LTSLPFLNHPTPVLSSSPATPPLYSMKVLGNPLAALFWPPLLHLRGKRQMGPSSLSLYPPSIQAHISPFSFGSPQVTQSSASRLGAISYRVPGCEDMTFYSPTVFYGPRRPYSSCWGRLSPSRFSLFTRDGSGVLFSRFFFPLAKRPIHFSTILTVFPGLLRPPLSPPPPLASPPSQAGLVQ